MSPLATSSGVFTLSAFGDFDMNSEYVSVSLDGFSLGPFLDNDPGNDLFDNASFGDAGNQYGSTFTASAAISQTTLQTLIADGSLTIFYTLGPQVHNLQNNPQEFLRASITYDVSAVPVPAALPLFASVLGLGGFLGWRRKAAIA